MLSPGTYHTLVPTDPVANLKFRRSVLLRCKNDPAAQAAVREACKQDILLYISLFVFQYNPDKVGGEVGPMIPWPFQADALLKTIHRQYTLRKDVMWEKSREMGATWFLLIKDDWLCRFHGRKKTFVMSHSEQAVDRPGDSDSLFWKIQFINSHLPSWLTRGVVKRKLGFNYNKTKSQITGAATTGRSGVGGRATGVDLDEFAKQTQAREIVGQTRDTGPRLIVSTHYGTGTEFYRLSQRPDVYKLVWHWSQHPDKRRGLYRSDPSLPHGFEVIDHEYAYPPDYQFVRDGRPFGGPCPGLRSPWYDTECVERASARDVAMHLDIDCAGSGWQFYDPGTIRGLVLDTTRDPVWEGDIHADPDTGRAVALVERAGGPLRLWLHPDGPMSFPVGRYGGGVDIAGGTGATPSTMGLADATLGLKVLEYGNPNLQPEAYAPVVSALGNLFRDEHGQPALVAWEMAGSVGEVFGKAFMGLGYRRVYYRPTPIKFAGVIDKTDKPGWYPSKQARGELHQHYRTALAKRLFTNPSRFALEQTLEFEDLGDDVRHAGEMATDDPYGARDNHGDYVVADALCWMVLRELGGKKPPRDEAREPTPGGWQWRRTTGALRDRELTEVWR